MLGCAILLVISVSLLAYSPRLAIAVLTIGVGSLLLIDFLDRRFAKPRARSRAEVAAILEAVVDDSAAGGYDELLWNDFVRYRIQDPILDQIRLRCAGLEQDPVPASGRLFSEDGERLIREIIKDLDGAA